MSKPYPMFRKLVILTCCLLLCAFCKVQAQCAPGETAVDVYIHAKGFAHEIYWKVVDSNASVIASTTPNTYLIDSTTYGPGFIPQHQLCLTDNMEYDFEAYDSFGDSWYGGTYELKRSCDNELIIDNGGQIPWNGYICCWVPCLLQSTESFFSGQCNNRDLRLDQVSVDPTVCAESPYYTDLSISNIGIYPIDTATLYGAVDGDTVDTTIYLNWPPGQKHTFPVGPFYSSGSPSGITHGVNAWVEIASDGNTNDNQLNSAYVTTFAQSHWLQTKSNNPGLTPIGGSISSELPFCDSTFLTLTSCSRIKEVSISPLALTSPTPLHIALIAPSGDSIVLIDSTLGPVSNLSQITFSDVAATPYTTTSGPGTYQPADPGGFTQLYNSSPSGVWKLHLIQADTNASISLHNWSIEFDQSIPLDLGADLGICGNNGFTYEVGATYANYLWSTGDSTAAIQIDQAGIYTVTVSDDFGCEQTDAVHVFAKDTVLAGQVTNGLNLPVANTTVELLAIDPLTSLAVPVASLPTNAQGSFLVAPFQEPQVYLRAVPDPAVDPTLFPTYYDGELLLSNAMPLAGNSQCDTIDGSFELIESSSPGGNGSISGHIHACDSSGPGNPVANQTIFLLDLQDQPIAWTVTNAQGFFQFSHLPLDTFHLWADRPGINNQLAPTLALDLQLQLLDSVVVCQYSDQLEVVVEAVNDSSGTGGTTGVFSAKTAQEVQVFPNPARDQLTIQWEESSWQTVTLINALGQAVLLETLSSTSTAANLNISKLDRGIYTVKLEGPTGSWQGKVALH